MVRTKTLDLVGLDALRQERATSARGRVPDLLKRSRSGAFAGLEGYDFTWHGCGSIRST